jgi:hypothetical protein
MVAYNGTQSLTTLGSLVPTSQRPRYVERITKRPSLRMSAYNGTQEALNVYPPPHNVYPPPHMPYMYGCIPWYARGAVGHEKVRAQGLWFRV